MFISIHLCYLHFCIFEKEECSTKYNDVNFDTDFYFKNGLILIFDGNLNILKDS